jgi:kinetochore protein Mis13/DSN1
LKPRFWRQCADTATEYEEEDNGFMFSRTRSKRTKAAQVPEPIVEDEPEPAKAPPARKTRKKSVETVQPEKENTAPRRRSARHSADKSNISALELETSKRRPKEPLVAKNKKTKEVKNLQDAEPEEDGLDLVGDGSRTPVHNLEINTDTTKIALPFADTPIIRRNKEMRKGERRSSLGMRGRRASSLIDSGTSNGENTPIHLVY